jgi:glycosyltransferase involved in cell wall biosynthesis
MVTRLALAQWRHLADELEPVGITIRAVVVADDENLEVAASYGFDTVKMDNSMLGAKVNAGISYAGEHGADFIVTIGSDDWVHPDFFLPLLDGDENGPPPPMPTDEKPWAVWADGPQVLGGRTMFLVDLMAEEGRMVRSNGAHGVIPWVFPRAVFAARRFQPVPRQRLGVDRGLDGAILSGLPTRPGWFYHDPHEMTRVDFKSSCNLTPYPGLSFNLGYGPVELDPWARLAEHYPAWLVDMARETCMTLADERAKGDDA